MRKAGIITGSVHFHREGDQMSYLFKCSTSGRISFRRMICLSLVFMLLAFSIAPSLGAGTPAKVNNAGKLVKMNASLDAKLTPQQVLQRLPILSVTSTDLALYRDSGTEFHAELKKWTVNWRDKSAMNLKFGWKTKEKNITHAAWQVSIVRFSPDPNNWENPAGLVASGKSEVPKTGGKAIFYVDLSKFAPQPPTHSSAIMAKGPKPNLVSLLNNGKSYSDLSKGKIIKVGLRKQASAAKPGPNLMHTDKMVIPLTNMVYYVRVVPLDKANRCVGIPSNEVEITYGEYIQDPVKFTDNPTQPNNDSWPSVNHPTVKILKYQQVRQTVPGASYHYVCIRDFGLVYKAGDKLDFTPHQDDDSFWDSLGDFFGDVVSFASGALNWVANAYQSIKEWAVNTVASVVGDWAKGPLMAGLNIGLAAMGLPPDIPNFGELTSMGTDYLIKAAADYSGLPPEETSMAVNALVDSAKATENGGGNPLVWLKPDPDYYYHPAYLLLEVKNTTQSPTERVSLNVTFNPLDDPDFKTYVEPVFTSHSVWVPTLQPGEKFTVPVFLKEYTQLRQLDTDINLGVHRFWIRYCGKPAEVKAYTFFAQPKIKNQYVTQQTLRLERCNVPYMAH